ncbi:hypothetical protein, partial [Vibrio vulnificus]|uniref:hypothetical protein n=1 Tax=Vibrio vulnificus TaxID=672 RepID=UPI0039B68B34
DKELAKLDKDIGYAQSKLNSNDFKAKAPSELIVAMEEKLQQTHVAIEKLRMHRSNIETLQS